MNGSGFIELPPNTTWRSSNQPLKPYPLGITNVYIGQARIAQVVKVVIGTWTRKELRYHHRIGFVTMPFDSDQRITEEILNLVPPSYRTLITFEAMEKVPAE